MTLTRSPVEAFSSVTELSLSTRPKFATKRSAPSATMARALLKW